MLPNRRFRKYCIIIKKSRCLWKFNMKRQTFRKIEKALGFRLHDWQKDYISMKSDYIPDERGCGATTAFILRHLLNYGEKIGDYSHLFPNKRPGMFPEYWKRFPCDRTEPRRYLLDTYAYYVVEIDKKLKSIGIDTCFE